MLHSFGDIYSDEYFKGIVFRFYLLKLFKLTLLSGLVAAKSKLAAVNLANESLHFYGITFITGSPW